MKNPECQEYSEQIGQLFSLLETDDFYWSGLAQNLHWLIIDHKGLDLKIKVSNSKEKLFVKVYSSIVENFAETAYSTLLELSKLDLSTPILAPLAICEGAIVFPLGENSNDSTYSKVYSDSERKQINAVLEGHGLLPLASMMRIGVIAINEQKYTVDLFQDDMGSLSMFDSEKSKK